MAYQSRQRTRFFDVARLPTAVLCPLVPERVAVDMAEVERFTRDEMSGCGVGGGSSDSSHVSASKGAKQTSGIGEMSADESESPADAQLNHHLGRASIGVTGRGKPEVGVMRPTDPGGNDGDVRHSASRRLADGRGSAGGCRSFDGRRGSDVRGRALDSKLRPR